MNRRNSPAQRAAVDEPPLGAIFGTGRSGSTWLGAMIDTHPGLAYRFEPFLRRRNDAPIRRLRGLLEDGQFHTSDVEDLYETLLVAHPLTDKPPFFPKEILRNSGRGWLCAGARSVPLLRGLYRRLYTPTGRPPVVFKEVTMDRVMDALLGRTGTRVVYIVRHPCGVVSSMVKGQSMGLMPAGRQGVLADILQKHDPELAATWSPRLATASNVEKEALLWRVDVERSLHAIRDHERAMMIVYEDLCRRPGELIDTALRHFGLTPDRKTAALVDEMVSGGQSARKQRRELWTNDYFSVFRNPVEASLRWKKDLDRETQARVIDVVKDSPAFQSVAAQGHWD